jgi:hypothetical protein
VHIDEIAASAVVNAPENVRLNDTYWGRRMASSIRLESAKHGSDRRVGKAVAMYMYYVRLPP